MRRSSLTFIPAAALVVLGACEPLTAPRVAPVPSADAAAALVRAQTTLNVLTASWSAAPNPARSAAAARDAELLARYLSAAAPAAARDPRLVELEIQARAAAAGAQRAPRR